MSAVQACLDSNNFLWVTNLMVLYAAGVCLYTLYSTFLALRAKRRANYAIRRALATDQNFRQMVSKPGPFSPADVELLRIAIRQNIRELSRRDQKFVNAGLRQKSVRGLERFVGEVVGHKLAA